MLYITQIHYLNDKINEVKQIYSLNRQDIEFQFNINTIIYAIKNGVKFKTAIWEISNGKPILVEGQNVILDKNDNIKTVADGVINNNLAELPTF